MPQFVKVSLSPQFGELANRPQLTSHMAEILTLWSQAEDELAIIFGYAMMTQPAIAAAVLSCTSNLATRLAMVQTALELGVSPAAASAFEKPIMTRIRKVAKRRNRIAHGIWTIHPDYPDDLIRFSGLGSPSLDSERWVLRDFLELKLAVAELQLQLREFAQTLPSARDQAGQTGPSPY